MDTQEPKEVAVPITSSWFKMKCTLDTRRFLVDVGAIPYTKRVEGPDTQIFRFHREREEYKPGIDTLKAALNLKLDEGKPSPEVVKFINDFGPLYHLEEFDAVRMRLAEEKMLEREVQMALAKVKIDNRQREVLAMIQSSIEKLESELAEGPFERWSTIYNALISLQRIFLEWKATDDVQGLTEHLKRLEPRLVKHDEGFVWEFGFTTLFDALVGFLALSIVEGRSWKTCHNPSCRKFFINGRRRFCGDPCRERYHNKNKSTPIGKERQRLYQTLSRRLKNELIDEATFEKIKKQLNKATTLDDLKAFERKNVKLYARLNPGPTRNGGPRKYKD